MTEAELHDLCTELTVLVDTLEQSRPGPAARKTLVRAHAIIDLLRGRVTMTAKTLADVDARSYNLSLHGSR